ncbi:MAG: hypothetical protein H6918_09025 [Sphingomonadaceae bacterium]|nr:hypothetical protein [Sphingomonadaceae bacterium]
MDQNSLAVFGTLFGTLATALATFALWRVTRVLAVETKRMADASSQPQVVATIVPNPWSTIHLDINVENTGNATAFDVEISFDPPLTNGEARGDGMPIPFQRISVLKPGQALNSYLSGVGDYLEQNFEVQISWKLAPNAVQRETLSYWLNMSDYQGVSYLGSRDPNVQIAEQVKKLREDWRYVASGARKTKVDVFTSDDRQREQDILQERFNRDKADEGEK